MVAVAPAGRRERKKRELRTRIFEIARRLFLEQGFEATTVEQIADAADVAPATFFNHFQSKGAVLSEMTEEVSSRLHQLLDEELARSASAGDRIAGFADRAAREVARSRQLAHNVLLELVRTSSRSGAPLPYLARVHERFAELLAEGQRRREVRGDRTADFLAEMVVGSFNAAVLNWMNDAAYPLERRLREVASFVREAIAVRPARRGPQARARRTASRRGGHG